MGLERLKPASAKESDEARSERVLSLFKLLSEDARAELIGELMETYCMISGHKLDEDGECPIGCEPEDLDDEDLDDEDADSDDDDEDGVDDDDSEEDDEEDGDE